MHPSAWARAGVNSGRTEWDGQQQWVCDGLCVRGGRTDGEGELEALGRQLNGQEASTPVWKSERPGFPSLTPLQVTSAGWLDGLDMWCVRCPAQLGSQLVPIKGSVSTLGAAGGRARAEHFQGDQGIIAWSSAKGTSLSAIM